MKKKIAVLLTAVMVLAMGMTAYASSPTTSTASPSTSTSTSKSSSGTSSSAKSADSYANVSAAGSGTVIVNGKTVYVKVKAVSNSWAAKGEAEAIARFGSAAKVLQMVDISLEGVPSDTPVTITVNVGGVVAGQKLGILHFCQDGTGRIDAIIPDAVGNGTVTFTTTGFSPFAFVAYNAAPQTGENAYILPAMMIICLAGVMICSKKVRFSK